MRRVPLVPTLVVALAVSAMVALGVWQLGRRHEKLALLDRYAANQTRAPVALPAVPNDRLLFRRVTAMCLRPAGWASEAGRSADGGSGWRVIARCATGAEGPGAAIQLGVADRPGVRPSWGGGAVSGYLTHAPQHRALIAGLFDHAPPGFLLVADRPLAGLKANPPADLSAVPNNHLAYAVQWFLFAGVAAVIYAVALRRREHPATPFRDRG